MSKPKKLPVASLAERAKKDPALLQRVLANPGLRGRLPDAMLSPAMRAIRTGNKPVTPGSTVTNRVADRQAGQAVDQAYGPNAAAFQQQRNTDQSGWYDQYRAELAKHQTGVAAAGDAAVAQIGQLQQGVAGLGRGDQADQTARTDRLNAVTGGQSADTTGTDSRAAAVRQALLSAMGGQQAGVNAANSNYAGAQANVVAPGQQLQARLGGQAKMQDLLDRMQSTRGQARDLIVQGEQKGVAQAAQQQAKQALALQLAGITSATSMANARTGATTSITTAQIGAKTARAGQVVARRGQDVSAGTAAAGQDVTRNGQNLSHQDRQASIAAAARKASEKAADKAAGKGDRTLPGGAKPVTPAQQGAFESTVRTAQTWVTRLRASGVKPRDIGALLVAGQAATKESPVAVPKLDALAVGMALDLMLRERGRHISDRHVQDAHRRGIKVRGLGPLRPKGPARGAGGRG